MSAPNAFTRAYFRCQHPPLSDDEFMRLQGLHSKLAQMVRLSAGEQYELAVFNEAIVGWKAVGR